jgi:hypothetical protein
MPTPSRAPRSSAGRSTASPPTSAKAAGQSTADIYPVLRLPGPAGCSTRWSSRPQAWGTSGVVEIGCYDTARQLGGAVIDADCFGSAIDVSAALAKIDLLMEAATQTPDKVNTKLRDILAMSATAADKWVDVCLTATNIGASPGGEVRADLHLRRPRLTAARRSRA